MNVKNLTLSVSMLLLLMAGMMTSPKAASAATQPGYYDRGHGFGVLVLYSGDARVLADELVQTTKTQDTLNSIAKILIKVLPYQPAWNFARNIAYNGINTTLHYEIYLSSWRSSTVAIYSWNGILYAAGPG